MPSRPSCRHGEAPALSGASSRVLGFPFWAFVVCLSAVCEYLSVEEFPERDAQARGYAVDVLDGDVAPAGLDLREVRARHLYRVRERLLAHAKAVSKLLDAEPDAHFGTKLSHRHLPFHGTNGSLMSYLSHPYISDNLEYNEVSDGLSVRTGYGSTSG